MLGNSCLRRGYWRGCPQKDFLGGGQPRPERRVEDTKKVLVPQLVPSHYIAVSAKNDNSWMLTLEHHWQSPDQTSLQACLRELKRRHVQHMASWRPSPSWRKHYLSRHWGGAHWQLRCLSSWLLMSSYSLMVHLCIWGSVCYDWAVKCHCGTWGCGHSPLCMKRNSEVVVTVVELWWCDYKASWGLIALQGCPPNWSM